jgi:hypothetical protein
MIISHFYEDKKIRRKFINIIAGFQENNMIKD